MNFRCRNNKERKSNIRKEKKEYMNTTGKENQKQQRRQRGKDQPAREAAAPSGRRQNRDNFRGQRDNQRKNNDARKNQEQAEESVKANFRKKEKKLSDKKIYAPCSGTLIPISDVEDTTYAQRLFGEGIALALEGDTLVSPCFGTLMMIPYTRHSFGIETDQGEMILVHAGFNTSQYRGRGFEVLMKEGAKVKPGMPVLKIDRKFFEIQNADMTICMVVTNSDKGSYRIYDADHAYAGKTVLMEAKTA